MWSERLVVNVCMYLEFCFGIIEVHGIITIYMWDVSKNLCDERKTTFKGNLEICKVNANEVDV